MTRCTEPERWPRAPGADAPEEEVESYLAHVNVCPLHAAAERREEELLRGMASLARRDLSAPVAAAGARAGVAGSGDRPDAQVEGRRARSRPDTATDRGRPDAGRRLSAAQRAARPSAEPARASRRYPVRRLAAALCVLAAVVLLALVLFSPTEQPVPVVRQEQPSRPPVSDLAATPEATPSVTDTQNRRDVTLPRPTATPRTSQGGVRVAPTPRAREQLTVADVRRIYVGAGEGTYDGQLREALIERLRDSDRFIVVAGERQADAVLLREQPRSAGVSVQLVTRGGKTLWYTTQPPAPGGVEDVGALAARIVAALTAAADERRSPVTPPRR
ncbi:MAG TPA: hypothetical protein VF591_22585 [Pyrinomonadaceae bacterium]|jgi:hypothetical protein